MHPYDPDPGYEKWVAEQAEWDRTHCGAQFTTPGSDPWAFTCDKPIPHPGEKHSMDNPMGPDTPTIEWK